MIAELATLGHACLPEERARLFIRALSDDDADVRRYAASGIAELARRQGSVLPALRKAVPRLMKLAQTPGKAHPNSELARAAAVEAVGSIGDTRQGRCVELFRLLLTEPVERKADGPLARSLAYALGALGDPRAVNILAVALRQGVASLDAALALRALVGRCDHGSAERETALRGLMWALQEGPEMTRAVLASKLYGLVEARPLARAMACDESAVVRDAARASLARYPYAVEELTRFLREEPDCGVRARLVFAVAESRILGREAFLHDAVLDGHPSVVGAAISGLGRLSGESLKTAEVMQLALRHPDAEVRRAAREAAGPLGLRSWAATDPPTVEDALVLARAGDPTGMDVLEEAYEECRQGRASSIEAGRRAWASRIVVREADTLTTIELSPGPALAPPRALRGARAAGRER